VESNYKWAEEQPAIGAQGLIWRQRFAMPDFGKLIARVDA